MDPVEGAALPNLLVVGVRCHVVRALFSPPNVKVFSNNRHQIVLIIMHRKAQSTIFPFPSSRYRLYFENPEKRHQSSASLKRVQRVKTTVTIIS